MIDSKKIRSDINQYLEKEGIAQTNTNSDTMTDFILPAMQHSKSTLSSLFLYQPTKGRNIVSKIKYTILSKLRNIVINVMERQSMRQQKFNELTFSAIELLIQENKELKKQIQESKK